MKTMVIKGFGGPEVFERRDFGVPEPGINDLLVRVHATSVNPVDAKIRRDGAWAGVRPPAVIGYDVAGVVEAAGAGVTAFKPGDEVFYTPEIFGKPGSYAEYHVVDESIVAAKPPRLSFEEAAALPLAGCTAWDAVVELAGVQPGETVLVHGASGGVGSLAVQMARASGARVVATCRRERFELVRALGAEVTIDYRDEDVAAAALRETGRTGVDAAFDFVGGETLARSLGCVRPYGRIVSIVGTTGDLNAAYIKNITVHFAFLERARYKVEALRRLCDQARLRPVVDRVLPLEDVAEAHRVLEAGGQVAGKIVLVP